MAASLFQMFRCLLIVGFIGGIPYSTIAQIDSIDYDYYGDESLKVDSQPTIQNDDLPSPSFSVSTGMVTGLGNDVGTYSYLSPKMRFPVSERFSLKTGLLLENRPGLGFNEENGYHSTGRSNSHTYFMAGGTYQLDQHLTLSGAGYMEIPGAVNSAPNSNSFTQSNKGFRINMEYEVNDHLHFDLGIQMHEGNSYRANPYLNNGFNNRPSPFGRPGRFGGF